MLRSCSAFKKSKAGADLVCSCAPVNQNGFVSGFGSPESL
jgi:hypothetical protein